MCDSKPFWLRDKTRLAILVGPHHSFVHSRQAHDITHDASVKFSQIARCAVGQVTFGGFSSHGEPGFGCCGVEEVPGPAPADASAGAGTSRTAFADPGKAGSSAGEGFKGREGGSEARD